jgi:formimidoylglutamate deiminase
MTGAVRGLAVTHLHQPGGWISPGYLTVDGQGRIASVSKVPPPDWDDAASLRLEGYAIPGMPNLHSHAFQRAMVGRAEAATPGQADSFWSWRSAMYRVAALVEPEDLEALAAFLYVEMLEAGYTAAGEFHYLHHPPAGGHYDDPTELSRRILEAARRADIGLTHLPVLYQQGGFGRPAEDHQRRFVHADPKGYLDLVARLFEVVRGEGSSGRRHLRIGIAPHSLRAVSPEALNAAVAGLRLLDDAAPVHLHIAEQMAEVEDCLAHHGRRPVALLLDTMDVDERWCLVHATHLDDAEVRDLAGSGAIAGLCPTTEANLGDGLFPAEAYLSAGGRFGVGSDSHASVSVIEELRLLEYGQRLAHRRRNVLAASETAERAPAQSVGRRLFDAAVAGGAQALGLAGGDLVPGRRADLVILDPEHPRLVGHGPMTALDAWIFGAAQDAIRDVFVGGRHVVEGGRHVDREPILNDLRRTMQRLRDRGLDRVGEMP